MITYLDTSVIVSLLAGDAHSDRAERLAEGSSRVVSDLCAAEFASALAALVRDRRLSAERARAAYADFDAWSIALTRVEVDPADIRAAEAIIRLLEYSLKAPDAIHIAIARRLGATLATFDEPMARDAARLGVAIAPA